MLMEIRDDVIWMKHLKGDPALYAAACELQDEEAMILSVDGVIGQWARMKRGKDGRPTMGLKPVGAMASVWARMQERRGEKVIVDQPDNEASVLLRLADETFEEWYSAEDEEAYGDLRPL